MQQWLRAMSSAMVNPPTAPKRSAEPENLFFELATLPPTLEAAQSFANRYGTLTGDAEPLTLWADEIANLRQAIACWLALEAATGRAIESSVTDLFPLTEPVPAHREVLHGLFDQPGEVLDLFGEIQTRIVRALPPERTRVRLHADYKAISFLPVPEGTCLIGRIWMRYASAVSEHWRLRRCAQCGTPFRVTDPRAMYCSAACKVAASRARRVKQ